MHWWAVVAGVMLGFCSQALAHTKWFSKDVGYIDKPLAVAAAPTFLGLTALSVGVVALLPLADELRQQIRAYGRLRQALASRRQLASNILRGAAAIALLLSWQAALLFAVTLPIMASAPQQAAPPDTFRPSIRWWICERCTRLSRAECRGSK